MRSIVIFRFFSHLPLLFVYQCITFLPLIFRFSLYITRKGGYHFLNNTDLISPSYQDYRTILAIPQSEIDVNPNIKQNEGYF